MKVKLHREVTLEVPVTVTAEGGEGGCEEKPAKKGRKAKAATDEPAPAEAADETAVPSDEETES